MSDQERKDFEAWCEEQGVDTSYWLSDPLFGYANARTCHYWTAWQARAALAQQAVPEGFALVQVDALTRWRDAFAEELAACDIDPPIHHVKTSHDEIAAVLAAAPAAPQAEQQAGQGE